METSDETVEYRYEVVSDRPLDLVLGWGQVAMLVAAQYTSIGANVVHVEGRTMGGERIKVAAQRIGGSVMTPDGRVVWGR